MCIALQQDELERAEGELEKRKKSSKSKSSSKKSSNSKGKGRGNANDAAAEDGEEDGMELDGSDNNATAGKKSKKKSAKAGLDDKVSP